MIDRAQALRWAEVVDSLRVVPRMLLFGYCGWAFHVIDKVLFWYTHLPLAEQTIQNAGMVTGVITAVTGFGVPIFSTYSANGRNWSGPSTAVPTVQPPP